jgi:hypothetical protein
MSDTLRSSTMDLFPAPSAGQGTLVPAADAHGSCGKPQRASRKRGLSLENAGKLGKAAAQVRLQTALDAGEVGYFSQLLVQTALPHKDPGEVDAWTRQNGRLSLTFSAINTYDPESKSHRRFGLPYGTHARLLFAWLGTEAVRSRSRRIELGDSFGDFMRRLQVPRNGGPKGSEAAIKNQLRRITWSALSWTYHQVPGQAPQTGWRDVGNLDVGQNIFPIETRLFYWDPANPDKRSLWQSEITLNETFFAHLLKYNVPVDMRVMRELAKRHASLAMDIYVWWTGRMHGLEKPTPLIPWRKLMEQLGTTHRNPNEFARDFKKEAEKVRVLYPEAAIKYEHGGIKLFPSPTHVPSRPLLGAG